MLCKSHTFFYLILIVMLTWSCKQKADLLADAKAEVMKIHDDAMAELGNIRTAVFELEELRKTSPDSIKIDEVVSQLENADDAMMDWMGNYVEPEDDKLKDFLVDQKTKISIVADKMYTSLEASKKYLNE